MKHFLTALKHVLFCQIICWGIFMLFDEEIPFLPFSGEPDLALIVGIIILVIYLILYYAYLPKTIKKKELSSLKYNTFLFIIWNITTILIAYALITLVDNNFLHVCTGDGWACFLNGLEYYIYPIIQSGLSALILFINLIIVIYKAIKKRITESNSKNQNYAHE